MLARCARVAPTFAHLASGLVAFLLVAHAAAGTTRLLTGPVPPEGWDYDFVGYPAISATGRHVAFTWDSWSVWVADCVTGTRRHLIGDGTSGPPEGWFGAKCPGISANGSFVTFAGMAGGGATQVYLMPRFGRTPTLISKAVNGKPGNGWSGVPARGVGSCVSDDGRYVAFMSGATDLMPGDAAGVGGVFLYDRGRRQMTRVSVLPDGTPSPEGGSLHSMTANGRYVSWDRNGWHGVYVYDTLTHRSERVDYRSDGKVGDGSWGRLSADGRWIVMRGTDLGPPGAPSRWPEQVYVRDLRDKVTSQESLSPEGASADKDCVPAGISADGRYVVFYSTAGNLTPEGSNSWAQVFVRDRALRKTACLSVSPSGALGNGNSGLTNNWAAVLSANGGFAAWCSNANNLAPSDTDGRGDVFVRDIDGPNGRRYAIEGKLCAPAGRLPAETRVQVLKGAKVVATGAPVPDGRFSVSPLQVGTYTVRPVAAGWEFLPPEREVTVVEDTRNLIFTGVPPATPGGFSETYWDAGLGMYGGVWAGPAAEWGPFAISGARVAATAGQDWGFRMGVERGPGGHELFTVRASNSGNVNLGFQIGPQIDATVAAVTAGFGAGVEARESFAREYQFAQVTGPGSQSLQQLELSVVTLSNFLNSPAGVTPGSRLLLNALLGAGADRIGFADLKWTERRGEVAGSASVGASLSVGAQINPTATASLTVADTTWGAAEARLATVVRENPHAGALDDVEVVHVVEQAQQVEVPFLAGTMTGAAEEMQTVTNPLAVLPEKGATGIWRWEAARTRTSDVGWMAGSFTADEQEGNSPFFSTSDAQTVRLEAIGAVPWEVHAAYAGSFAPRILADSLFDLDDPKLHMGGGAMREDLAGWYTCLEKYSEDHPAGIVANFRRTRDRSEGGAFDLSVGLGIGFGLTCGVKGSLVKGFRYDDLGGGISGGDLTFDYSNTDATVPPEDPRTFAEVCRAFLVPTVQRHKPELLERFSSSQGTVGGGQQAPPAGDSLAAGNLTVGSLATGGLLIAPTSQWAAGSKLSLGAYSADLEAAPGAGAARPAPYRFWAAPAEGVAAGLQYSPAVGVGKVCVVRAERSDGGAIGQWALGAARLRVRVSTLDLTNRGIDAGLLDQVQLFRMDPATYAWSALDTTLVQPGVFEAELSQDGEYMPGLSRDVLDATGPTFADARPGPGATLGAFGTLEVTVRDRPAGLSAGIDEGSIRTLVDGAPIARELVLGEPGEVQVRCPLQGAIAAGAHTWTVAARDNLGKTARRHLAFTVVNTPDLVWEGGQGYATDGVQPNRGQADDTVFAFKVKLRDADADRPDSVELQLQQGGVAWRSVKLHGETGSLRQGRVFATELKLPAGTYRYRFIAQDDDGAATGEPTLYRSAPRIMVEGTASAPALILSAVATPAHNGGTQITFALAAPATLEARVLNLAGRPVRTLCVDRPCAAGANTLLWNGLSDAGLRAPSGMYLIELVARGADGTQARRAVPVRR